MKTNQLLSRTLCSAMFAAAVMFGSSSAFAQVKIGTAPTTIDANSNLEVQATNNKKVIVHKDNGTVVIENTPSGAITDSIMTIDASGNVRAIDKNRLKNILGILGSSSMTTTVTQSFAPGAVVIPDFTTIIFDENNGIDLANDNVLLKVAGTYTISITSSVLLPPPAGATANVDMYLQKFTPATGLWTNIGRNQVSEVTSRVLTETLTYVGQFEAGARVRVALVGCIGCIAGNPDYTLLTTDFFVLRNL